MLPAVLSLYVTNHCQLKCGHCFWVRSHLLNTQTMDYGHIVSILDDARDNRVYLVPLSGGDPLLHQNIFEIIADIRSRKMLPLLGITGLGVDSALAARIKESGVPCVQVSLDGHNEPTNSMFRGKGVFGEVLQSIDQLTKAGVNTNIAICITPQNAGFLYDILDMAMQLRAFRVKISFWDRYGNACDATQYELSDDQKRMVALVCEDYQKKHRIQGWITSPSMYFSDANPNRSASKFPPLIIHPNGNFTIFSEFGPIIGNIRQGRPSYFYGNYLRSVGHETRA